MGMYAKARLVYGYDFGPKWLLTSSYGWHQRGRANKDPAPIAAKLLLFITFAVFTPSGVR